MNEEINDWENPKVFQHNRLPARAYLMSYPDEESALSGERGRSPRFKLLNGNWKFRYAEGPALAPEDFFCHLDFVIWIFALCPMLSAPCAMLYALCPFRHAYPVECSFCAYSIGVQSLLFHWRGIYSTGVFCILPIGDFRSIGV